MRLLLFSLVWLVLLSGTALAHTPIFLQARGLRRDPHGGNLRSLRGPLNRSPDYSWAYYGHLATGGRPDVLPLEVRQGQPLVMHISIPQRRNLQGLQPRVVMLGPGLTEDIPSDLPVSVEEALGVHAGGGHRGIGSQSIGALALPITEGPTASSFEPFTQVHYWRYGAVSATFPATGRYAIVVYDPSGRGGPYTLAIGARERLGPRDILGFPLTWARVRVWLWK